jgi:hypothetical protein
VPFIANVPSELSIVDISVAVVSSDTSDVVVVVPFVVNVASVPSIVDISEAVVSSRTAVVVVIAFVANVASPQHQMCLMKQQRQIYRLWIALTAR